ncbi:sterol 26-hydroxylase, mitochondrial [Toxotes jaculatrix]|uniref:sterol 26-hydroxylase, mitochondrial n=1 Tax=Toxotes jaculatrix TaxID=941984 RepID=UPI001B3A94BF|nr:sterol 26-hydroxylase, mitochondrial [Toxotes jaculatrix]XP_040887912.1 sterol 26-hydroxylase, mitochondrial [Toxotes jaculatrix]XP_040887913.1 sterol 26-hydroxylase, mitochondrial [Toxotes jaculatrix]
MGSPAAAARPLRLSALCARTLPATRAGAELRPGASVAVLARRDLNVQTTAETGKLKSIHDLPGPSVSTTLYWLFVKGYADKSHLMQGLQKSLFGPIWRSRFGPFDLVNVASPELIAQVIQQEGRYPVRAELPHWKEYRELRGQAYGLHVDTGPEWYRIRSALNPKMLKLREVSAFAPIIHQVVGDLIQRIELLRSQSPDRDTVSDLASELYKFGFEGISSILFETRLGCLQEEIPQDTLRFIAAVNNMLTLSDMVVLFPRWSRSILPFWKRFVQAWDDLFDVAKTLIDRRMAEIEAQVHRGEPADGMYLTYLLSSDKLTRAELYISITELLLGGVDTTSNTLSWTLYHLARDPRVQDRLHREVSSVCPDRREPTTDDLNRMPYLKAVIKETLRLYPVVPGNGRFVSENEVIVNNYWFPKKTQFHLCHYAVCHDEAQFVDAERFIPERWLRAETPDGGGGRAVPGLYQHHPYSFIPFGVGVRACVGKRVAEMEMYFALSRLMQHYEVHPEDGAPTVEPKTRTLLIPAKPINLRFLPRA